MYSLLLNLPILASAYDTYSDDSENCIIFVVLLVIGIICWLFKRSIEYDSKKEQENINEKMVIQLKEQGFKEIVFCLPLDGNNKVGIYEKEDEQEWAIKTNGHIHKDKLKNLGFCKFNLIVNSDDKSKFSKLEIIIGSKEGKKTFLDVLEPTSSKKYIREIKYEIDGLKNFCEYVNDKISYCCLSEITKFNFQLSSKIIKDNNLLLVDYQNQKVYLKGVSDFDGVILEFSQLNNYKIVDEELTNSKVDIESAIVGGVLFGTAGAIIGGQLKNKQICTELKLLIFINGNDKSLITFDFISDCLGGIDKSSELYNKKKSYIYELIAELEKIKAF